jgi:hypothetical protein
MESYPFPFGRLRQACTSLLVYSRATWHTTIHLEAYHFLQVMVPYALPQATWLLEHRFLVKSEVKYHTLSIQLSLSFSTVNSTQNRRIFHR